MPRCVRVILGGVLGAVLCSGVAGANELGSQLFARAFGEATATGSPVRGLSFNVDLRAASNAPEQVLDVFLPALSQQLFQTASFGTGSAFEAARYAPVSTPNVTVAVPSIATPAAIPLLAYYHDAQPAPTNAPYNHRFDLQAYDTTGQTQGASLLDLPQQSTDFGLPVRLGHVRVTPHAQASQAIASADQAFTDKSVGAGATFDLGHASGRKLGLDLSSNFEHLTLDSPTFSNSSFNVNATGLANDNLPIFVPTYADVSQRTLSAGLNVPLARGLIGNVSYDTQHLLGGYGIPGESNLDANNVVYSAGVSFQLPKSASMITFSAKQFHFQDNLIPTNAFVQTSANVDFTVKF